MSKHTKEVTITKQKKTEAVPDVFTDAEKKIILRHKEVLKTKVDPIRFKILGSDNKYKKLGADCENEDLIGPLMAKCTGVASYEAACGLISQVHNAICDREDSLLVYKANFIAALMTELAPRDGFEGMLISQMVAVFHQALNAISMANNAVERSLLYERLQNQGVKLMRLYCQQLEALDKHRNKGKQKVTVEHVHVHQGGKAIVGDVHHQGGRGEDGK